MAGGTLGSCSGGLCGEEAGGWQAIVRPLCSAAALMLFQPQTTDLLRFSREGKADLRTGANAR